MAFRFRRRDGRKGRARLLGADTGAAARVLAQGHEGDRGFDLRAAVSELFAQAPTRDVGALKDQGVDSDTFYDKEIAPNWDGLRQGERAAKIEAFTRLANALHATADDPGGMGPLVRTKLLVLAWGHDRSYGEDYLERIDRAPERFGDFEPAR